MLDFTINIKRAMTFNLPLGDLLRDLILAAYRPLHQTHRLLTCPLCGFNAFPGPL